MSGRLASRAAYALGWGVVSAALSALGPLASRAVEREGRVE